MHHRRIRPELTASVHFHRPSYLQQADGLLPLVHAAKGSRGPLEGPYYNSDALLSLRVSKERVEDTAPVHVKP